mgnify:CR=1 FL=1
MPDRSAAVAWKARGESRAVRGAPAQVWLHLEAEVPIALVCQRCLQPCPHEVKLERLIHFARDEAEAARLDAESEDDVLALTRSLDLHELLEDELLLDLPLVPRHEHCPLPVMAAGEAATQPEVAAEPARNPFAALAALKRTREGR